MKCPNCDYHEMIETKTDIWVCPNCEYTEER